MSFKAVWGFDPDEVPAAHIVPQGETGANEASCGVAEQYFARIPADIRAQVYELRRLFRLQQRR
jgi:hypothetical protein